MNEKYYGFGSKQIHSFSIIGFFALSLETKLISVFESRKYRPTY